MSTLTDFIADLETALDALPGATRARMPQDYGDELVDWSVGGSPVNDLYQIRATLLNQVNTDSAQTIEAVQVEVFMHHRLDAIGDEPAYTSGGMATDQSALLARSFWEGLASVLRVLDDDGAGPVVNELPEREGKRITYSVGVRLALQP